MSTPDLNPDVPGLTGRIGGPLGTRVRRSGVWFDPMPWAFGAAVVTWIVVMLRQIPCVQTTVDNPVNNYLRLCYSDIPILYQSREWWSGGPIASGNFEYPPLVAGFIWVARWLAGLFGAQISPETGSAQRLDGAYIFFGVNAALLFGLFLITVWAHLRMGANSASRYTDGVKVRSWDAIFIAAAPVVMATGIINWDLLPVALTSLAILAWSNRRPVAAGLWLGLACSAKFYPILMIAVLLLLCMRSAKMRSFGTFFLGVVGGWLVANLPLMLSNFDAWSYFWRYNLARTADLGSIWYVLGLLGLEITAVNLAFVISFGIAAVAIAWLVFVAPRRPRLGQLAFLIVVAFLIFNKVYSPQYVLWLLPLLVLARPRLLDILVFTISEVLYFCAVWGYLEGILQNDARIIYIVAVYLRIAVQVWLAVRVIRDILEPWQDPVRGPFVDDPVGGVLDHAADAEWMLRPAVAPARAADPDEAPLGELLEEDGATAR